MARFFPDTVYIRTVFAVDCLFRFSLLYLLYSQDCEVLRSACLCIFLLVCLLVPLSLFACLKNHVFKFHEIFSTFYLWPWPDLLCRQCNKLCTFAFVNDVIFSHGKFSEPESKTMLCFVEFTGWRHQSDVRLRYVWSSSPGGGTGGEVWCLRLPCFSVLTRAVLFLLKTLVSNFLPHVHPFIILCHSHFPRVPDSKDALWIMGHYGMKHRIASAECWAIWRSSRVRLKFRRQCIYLVEI